MITDLDDHPMEIGTRVTEYETERCGTVTDLGEWDGDVDDEGRSYGVPPRVAVVFDDGGKGYFETSEWEHPYYGPNMDHNDGTGKCEDLNVIQAEGE